jgi:hypothetical protein
MDVPFYQLTAVKVITTILPIPRKTDNSSKMFNDFSGADTAAML